MFLQCNFVNWKQVCEAKTDIPNEPTQYPTDIEWVSGNWTKIYNSDSPVQSVDNQNDTSNRSQGVWFQGKDWRFIGITALGIGWDILGDPGRTKTDKFSQIIYIAQSGQGITIENCSFDGTANNAIVCKGTNLTVRGCTFDRIVNAISLGTNQSPVFSCSALIENCVIDRLIALNHLDDPSLPSDEQIRADSGVAISINNVDGVTIDNVNVTGVNTGRRSSFLFVNNAKSSNVLSSGITVNNCDTGTLRLAEVRNYRMPAPGLEVACTSITSPDELVLVPNTIPTDASLIVAEFTIDGAVAGTQ